MRVFALLSLLLVAAGCSSSGGFEDERILGCGAGQDIEVRAGLNAPRTNVDFSEQRVTMLVEVSNLSHQEILVKSIRIEQDRSSRQDRFEVDPVWQNVDRTIPEDEEYTFEIPMTGRGMRRDLSPGSQVGGSTELVFVATVHLGNGDTYRCAFGVQAPV